jgi:hypothetical protein
MLVFALANEELDLHYRSVGDHRPVGRDRIRSRPKNLKTSRDPEKNSGRDP